VKAWVPPVAGVPALTTSVESASIANASALEPFPPNSPPQRPVPQSAALTNSWDLATAAVVSFAATVIVN